MLQEVNGLVSLQSVRGRWIRQRLAPSSATAQLAEKAHNAHGTTVLTVAAEAAVLEAFGAGVFEVVDLGAAVADAEESMGRFPSGGDLRRGRRRFSEADRGV